MPRFHMRRRIPFRYQRALRHETYHPSQYFSAAALQIFLFIKTKLQYMKAEKLLERITLDPNIMTGKPVIRGTRLTVQYILGLLAHGASVEEILEEYKGLTREDIQACLLFATESLEDTTFMPLTAEAC
jgi:uncharacterized protein (DUF433 family)